MAAIRGYVWKKYNVTTKSEYALTWETGNTLTYSWSDSSSPLPGGGLTGGGGSTEPSIKAYSTYVYDSISGTITVPSTYDFYDGVSGYCYIGFYKDFPYISVDGIVYKVTSYTSQTGGPYNKNIDYILNVEKAVISINTVNNLGSYIQDVSSLNTSQYPSNGIHSDGYWYIYQGVIYNNLPSANITIPELKSGKSVTISWSFSDADNDTVTSTSLVRYQKTVNDSSYQSVTLTTNNVTSYTDTIPESLANGSVYYILTFTDGYDTATVTSNTVTVIQSCNVNVVISGVITAATDVATIQSGVITTMNSKLHPIVSGVIT